MSRAVVRTGNDLPMGVEQNGVEDDKVGDKQEEGGGSIRDKIKMKNNQ